MLHIITEDSTTGREFWELFLRGMSYKQYHVYTSAGVSNISVKLEELVTSIDKVNDIIFLSIDNIDGKEYDSNLQLKENTIPKEDTEAYNIRTLVAQYLRGGYKIFMSSFYCIEELLLSYTPLINVVKHNLVEPLSELQRQIRLRNRCEIESYFLEIMSNYADNLNINGAKNLEKMLKSVYTFVTKSTSFAFYQEAKYQPMKLGPCWFEPCCSSKQAIQKAQRCFRYNSNLCTKEKAIDIYKNSILNDSITIEVLARFDKPSNVDANSAQYDSIIQRSDNALKSLYECTNSNNEVNGDKTEIKGF